MRWWRIGLGAALLIWVLGAAYYQARRRGHSIGSALVLFGASVLCFLIAAFYPRPPVTDAISQELIVAAVVLLAAAMGIVLMRGFTGRSRQPRR